MFNDKLLFITTGRKMVGQSKPMIMPSAEPFKRVAGTDTGQFEDNEKTTEPALTIQPTPIDQKESNVFTDLPLAVMSSTPPTANANGNKNAASDMTTDNQENLMAYLQQAQQQQIEHHLKQLKELQNQELEKLAQDQQMMLLQLNQKFTGDRQELALKQQEQMKSFVEQIQQTLPLMQLQNNLSSFTLQNNQPTMSKSGKAILSFEPTVTSFIMYG